MNPYLSYLSAKNGFLLLSLTNVIVLVMYKQLLTLILKTHSKTVGAEQNNTWCYQGNIFSWEVSACFSRVCVLN